MIIKFKTTTPATIITQIKQLFENDYVVKEHGQQLAIINQKELVIPNQYQAYVETVITDEPTYVMSSRQFHLEDTIIKTKHSIITADTLTMMAGPCSVESKAQIMALAEVVKKSGATILRGGAYKPRTSPYNFQGLAETGLKYLRQAADKHQLDVVTEVMDETHVELVGQYTDIFQIGARNMQNFSLLKAVGKTNIPVLLKRGLSATIDDLLNAAEYIAANGNTQIILMERGIRTFDNQYTRNTFDLNAVPVLKKLTHYPIFVDPSHATGERDLVAPMAKAGIASGASGIMLEIHSEPQKAFSDGMQALLPEEYLTLSQQLIRLHNFLNEAN